jgi:hypothetical protein
MKLGSLARSLVRYFGPRATSVSPQNGVSMTVSFESFSPPKAPATSHEGNVTPWAAWQRQIDTHYTPAGWTFCKFGVRGADEHEAGEVWGIVRDGFGAYWCRFYVHEFASGHHGEEALAVVVNARTGYALGIFVNLTMACEAAEIALRLSSHDSNLLVHALGTAGYLQGGIICRPMRDAAVVQGPPIPVWMRPDIEKPAEVRPS